MAQRERSLELKVGMGTGRVRGQAERYSGSLGRLIRLGLAQVGFIHEDRGQDAADGHGRGDGDQQRVQRLPQGQLGRSAQASAKGADGQTDAFERGVECSWFL